MKRTFTVTLIGLSLVLTACAGSGSAATATPEAIPPVLADSTIIAEGRLEPVHFAEVAFTASGRVSEILVTEGQPVTQGDERISPEEWAARLGTVGYEVVCAIGARVVLVGAKGALGKDAS